MEHSVESSGILEEKISGVTITPGSLPEQRNRAAERCYIAARARKRAGTKNCLSFVAGDFLRQKRKKIGSRLINWAENLDRNWL